ncbi:hypothetical protein [Ligilactobacillus apodemi]|uniref:hypothetical protein n=1 Tax=Ligilactobacillus apodemi TaxID=307126 RepID=UPI00214C9DD6|nr:hypothetical protein [Ligilactobacillus apodemi]MCR1900721.1 hypothetical protein [Ligilactobacillus apodemi]
MLKRFVVLYCSTLGVLFMSVCLSLFFRWYDTNFRLVIPDKIYSIYLNNVGVFGRTILLSIASFGFLGIILLISNIIVLSTNLASIIAVYGFGRLSLVMIYGVLELAYIPISICAIIELWSIAKLIYRNKRITKVLLLNVAEKFRNIFILSVTGVFVLIFASVLEFLIGKML